MNKDKSGRVPTTEETAMDLQAMTDRILRRDRRRIWLLGIVCIIAWMMVVMLPWATILPMLGHIVQFQSELVQSGNMGPNPERDKSLRMLKMVKVATFSTFLGSVASMFVAALSTVGLILHSRRATLRQVNARLAEISEQLKMMSREMP